MSSRLVIRLIGTSAPLLVPAVHDQLFLLSGIAGLRPLFLPFGLGDDERALELTHAMTITSFRALLAVYSPAQRI